MTYLYDAKTNAFYPFALQEDYEAVEMWPETGIEIDEETFVSFQNPEPGKMRAAGEGGYPVWVDIPPLTHEQQVQIAETDKQSRIAQANNFINSKQWPGKAALGRLTGDGLTQYNLWLDYLDGLEAVDTSTYPDINWPAQPAEYRQA